MAFVLTAVTAIATLFIALASARSAQSSALSANVMERMYRSYYSANLRLRYLVCNELIFPENLQPILVSMTPEYVALAEEFVKHRAESPAPWRKHSIHAVVKNLGLSLARNVNLEGRLNIHQPDLGDFSRDVGFFTSGPSGLPVLEIEHNQAVLVHTFETPSAECHVRHEAAKITYKTLSGETRAEEVLYGESLTYATRPSGSFQNRLEAAPSPHADEAQWRLSFTTDVQVRIRRW